ncbi:MAG: YHYH protein, partial [Planctomycetaceae bacterium]|nr:YHYH protein [Planctomycetaceae bacterium]
MKWIRLSFVWCLQIELLVLPGASWGHDGPHPHIHGTGNGHDGVPTEFVAFAPGTSNRVSIEIRDGFRYITANGIPDHETGQFPNRGNPNSIRPQSYVFRVPINPQPKQETDDSNANERSDRRLPSPPPLMGVALNGVVFDPGTAEFWRRDPRSGWNYEALSGKIDLGLDESNAHVQPTGAYHYHGVPNALMEQLGGNAVSMLLLGYAADGFPIYAPRAYSEPLNSESEIRELKSSYRLRSGPRPVGSPGGRFDGTFVQDYEFMKGLGDLDEYNGRVGVTPEYPQGIYYYVITNQFP